MRLQTVHAEPQEHQTLPSATLPNDHADRCKVCLIQSRDFLLALVPFGYQRFCESCADEVNQCGRECPNRHQQYRFIEVWQPKAGLHTLHNKQTFSCITYFCVCHTGIL